jgi:hypothetical protein
VVLIKPDPMGDHPTWRARYFDPDTGRSVKERLDPVTLSTAEARRDWAVRKSKALTRRRFELEARCPPEDRHDARGPRSTPTSRTTRSSVRVRWKSIRLQRRS